MSEGESMDDKELTLLKKIEREQKKTKWFAFAVVGSSIIMTGVGLWIGKGLHFTDLYSQCPECLFLLIFGFVLMGVMLYLSLRTH